MDLAGLPGSGASTTARGFVGIAFRATPHAAVFDCFYLRPTNGRADDQLRRNHSTQYVSEPEFRLAAAAHTRRPASTSRTSISRPARGRTCGSRSPASSARLFVNGATQPALIVNDLKRGVTSGAVGLWIGPGTEAYFRNLRVTPAVSTFCQLPDPADDGSVVDSARLRSQPYRPRAILPRAAFSDWTVPHGDRKPLSGV